MEYKYFQRIDGAHMILIPDDTEEHKKEIEALRQNKDYREIFELVD